MYHLTPKSANTKTGPIPVSTSPDTTCPDACPFKKNGCYGDSGPIKLHWLKVSDDKRGSDWQTFTDAIRNLPNGQLWRHNQVGDLPGQNDSINVEMLTELVSANTGKRGFTYTHKPVLNNPTNLEAVKAANAAGFTINLSANNLEHADKLADTGLPVTVVLPLGHTGNTKTPSGRIVVQCPATRNGVNTNCSKCQLCQRQNRAIVGFPAHGTGAKSASAIAKGE